MLLGKLPVLADDPVGQVYRALHGDPNPDKLDLGVGVYRDAEGRSPLMACIRTAQQRLAADQATKAYLPPSGNAAYARRMEALVFGAGHPVLRDGRILTVQTPGAGGGLRAAGELIKATSPSARIWVPAPTWDHQLLILGATGVELAEHPYYDPQGHRLLFDAMLASLETARRGDVVLLHGCCHNPTGADLDHAQWRVLTELIVRRGLVPLVDLVYQGLGDDVETDAFATRLLAEQVPEMLLVSSSSKSFAVYRDRAGILSVIAQGAGAALANAERHVSRITRSLYFMPPDLGAALVVAVLDDPDLTRQWQAELSGMRDRIARSRARLLETLSLHLPSRDFAFVTAQKGMFSLLGLTTAQVVALGARHSIYLMPDGRINVAALRDDQAERVALALADVLQATPVEVS